MRATTVFQYVDPQQAKSVHYPDSDFNQGEHYWSTSKPLATGWRRMLNETHVDDLYPEPTEEEHAAIRAQDREEFGSETPTLQERTDRRKLWDPATGQPHQIPNPNGGNFVEGLEYPDWIDDPDDPVWTHPNVSADAVAWPASAPRTLHPRPQRRPRLRTATIRQRVARLRTCTCKRRAIVVSAVLTAIPPTRNAKRGVK